MEKFNQNRSIKKSDNILLINSNMVFDYQITWPAIFCNYTLIHLWDGTRDLLHRRINIVGVDILKLVATSMVQF